MGTLIGFFAARPLLPRFVELDERAKGLEQRIADFGHSAAIALAALANWAALANGSRR
jgi:hypothetical protein